MSPDRPFRAVAFILLSLALVALLLLPDAAHAAEDAPEVSGLWWLVITNFIQLVFTSIGAFFLDAVRRGNKLAEQQLTELKGELKEHQKEVRYLRDESVRRSDLSRDLTTAQADRQQIARQLADERARVDSRFAELTGQISKVDGRVSEMADRQLEMMRQVSQVHVAQSQILDLLGAKGA